MRKNKMYIMVAITLSLISSIAFANISVESILSQANNMPSAERKVNINQSDMDKVRSETSNKYRKISEFVNNGIRIANSSRSYSSSSVSSSQVQCNMQCDKKYDEDKICKGLDTGTFAYTFSKHADCSSRVYRAKSKCELECYQKYH